MFQNSQKNTCALIRDAGTVFFGKFWELFQNRTSIDQCDFLDLIIKIGQ